MKKIRCLAVIFIAALAVTAAFPFMGGIAGGFSGSRVFAATQITKVDLTCDAEAIDLSDAWTEGEVDSRIQWVPETNIGYNTVGCDLRYESSGLRFWQTEGSEDGFRWWGIGDGTNKVRKDRLYALYYCIKLNEGYTWGSEITGAPKKQRIITESPTPLTVTLNGVTRTDVWYYNQNYNMVSFIIPFPFDISDSVDNMPAVTYNGSAITPAVKIHGDKLRAGTDYTVSWTNNINAGTASAVITGKGTYKGKVTKTFTIRKAANPMAAKGKTVKVRYAKLKKNNQTITAKNAFKVSRNVGKLAYKKVSGNKKIAVSKSGKVTVKKGLKKGQYKVKVKITASGNQNYKKFSKKVTLTVRVK